MSADKVIVSGYLAHCPLGGYAWQVLHYLTGLRQLGFEPYFYEDTGTVRDCFAAGTGIKTDDPRSGAEFARDFLSQYGFHNHWMVWDALREQTYGPPGISRNALLAEARIVINLAGVTRLPPVSGQRRIFVDLDPAFTQIRAAGGDRAWREILSEYDLHCTLGENIGAATCRVPAAGFAWHATRQPVALELWQPQAAGAGAPFTTVGRWDEQRREVHFEGEVYSWRKRVEWMRFLELPQRCGQRFVLAMDAATIPEDLQLLQRHGWEVRDPLALSSDPFAYREFIRGSKGEFTVAKDLNVRLATGWFSDRSACYLAAARPVVTQDTGFGSVLPSGAGLFAFKTVDEAVAAIAAISADYDSHARAARQIAERFFAAERVLGDLLRLL